MKYIYLIRRGAALGMLICSALSAIGAGVPVRGQYRVIDLGRLDGFRSEARGINARGDIAGLTTTDIGYQAARWQWDGTNYVIQALGKGEAYGIADDGTVAGLGESTGATLWAPSGAATSLGLDKGVNAISGSGIPVGYTYVTLTNPNFPFNVKFPKHAAWFAGGSGIDLAQRPEWDCEVAGVDRTGMQRVGNVLTNTFAGGSKHAWLFPGRDLHTLTNYATSFALAANASTQVVGRVNSGPFSQPMFWSEATGMRLLNAPGGTPYGSALGVNDAGQAVGALGSGAVLWVNIGQTNETNVFLSDLLPFGHGWTLQVAHGINNRGEIVGYGSSPTGGVNGFCLVPTNLVTRKIEGKVVVLGGEPFGEVTTNWLERAQVTLLKAAPNGQWISADYASVGYAGGEFSLTVRESPDARFRLRVTLSDPYGDMIVCDEPTGPDFAAWLETPEFTAPTNRRADIEMFINLPRSLGYMNRATYFFNGQQFDVGALNTPPGLPVGDSSVNFGNFAHLAVIYRNIRLSERFTRDELHMSVLPLRVVAYSETNTSWGPSPQRPTIFIEKDDSPYNPTFGPNHRRRGGMRPTNREFHEYGHHIMWSSPLGIAPFRMPGVNHAGLTNGLSSDSWVEGFAEFIGAAIADRMLDANERDRSGLYRFGANLQDLNQVYSMDNPARRGVQGNASPQAMWRYEELVIAALLWDFYAGRSNPRPPLDEYVQTITGFYHPYVYVTNVNRLYETLMAYANARPAELSASHVTDRFIKAGFFDDQTFDTMDTRTTNGLFDAGETVGVTSWNTNFLHRPNFKAPLSTYVHIDAFDEAGGALSDVRADFRTVSPPPWDQAEITNSIALNGAGPWEFPVIPSPPPSTLVIRLSRVGLLPSAELMVDSEWFQTRQAEAAPGELLLEHNFILTRANLHAVRRADGMLEIFWPADLGEVVLEGAASFPATVWTAVAVAPTTVAGERRVTLTPADATRFFRLRAP